LLIAFRSPGEEQEPTVYLKESIATLTNYLVAGLRDRNLLGIRIRNTENVQDKVVGIRFRRREQLKPDVVWGIFGKVFINNARFGLSERHEVHSAHVRMPAGNCKRSQKTKGRLLDVMSVTRRSFVVVKAEFLCLANVLIIAMSRLNCNPKYT